MRARLLRAVVAAEASDGTVVYVYGWAEQIDHGMERHRAEDRRRDWLDPEWTSAVRWAEPPTQSMRYPTDADFARALPANRQLPAPAPVALDAGGART